MHVIRVLAIDTEHDDAVNASPLVPPYLKTTVCPLVGPKFVPSTTIDSPPAVPSVLTDAKLTSVIAGAVYDNVEDDKILVCPPTDAFHLWPAPTPADDVHVMTV